MPGQRSQSAVTVAPVGVAVEMWRNTAGIFASGIHKPAKNIRRRNIGVAMALAPCWRPGHSGREQAEAEQCRGGEHERE